MLLFAGDGVQAKANHLNNGSGDLNVTTLSFEPNLILSDTVIGSQGATPARFRAIHGICINDATNGVKQHCVSWFESDANPTADPHIRGENYSMREVVDNGGNTQGGVEWKSFSATSPRAVAGQIPVDPSGNEGRVTNYLALKLDDVKLNLLLDKTATTGTKSLNFGFKPQAMMGMFTRIKDTEWHPAATTDSIADKEEAGSISHFMYDGTNRVFMSAAIQYASGNGISSDPLEFVGAYSRYYTGGNSDITYASKDRVASVNGTDEWSFTSTGVDFDWVTGGLAEADNQFFALAIQVEPILLDGTATGTSSATATLTNDSALTGTATGTSSATGTLTKVVNMVGTAVGTATATAAMTAVLGLAGTATGTSSAVGTMTMEGVADVKAAVVNLPAPTASGALDFTSTGFGQVKGALFLGGGAISLDTTAAHASLFIGGTDGRRGLGGTPPPGSSHASISNEEGNSDTSTRNVGLYDADLAGIWLSHSSSSSSLTDGHWNDWVTDGVSMSMSGGFETYPLTAVLFGGDDLTAFCDRFTSHATQDSATNVVCELGATDQADLVFFWNTRQAALDGTQRDHAKLSIGVWSRNSNTQASFEWSEKNFGTTAENYVRVSTNGVATDMDESGTITEKIQISAHANGFTATTKDDAGGIEIGYLALRLNNATSTVSFINSPTSTTSDVEETLGFQPAFAGLIGTLAGAIDTTESGTDAGGFSIGVTDGVTEAAYSYQSQDGKTNPMVGKSRATASESLHLLDTAGTGDILTAGLSATPLTSNGIKYDWTVTGTPGAKKQVLFAFGPTPSVVTVDLVGTAAGTSSATATLTNDSALTGTATGTSSATATLTVQVLMTGTAAGTSSATATLTNDSALTGTATGTSSAMGALSIGTEVALVGTATGTASATGTLSAILGMTGTATGISSATAVLANDSALVGTATGTSSATGVLTFAGGAVVQLAGTATGTSSATASLALTRQLSAITYFGNTWTLNQAYESGTFVGGEPWVLAPSGGITVTAITQPNGGDIGGDDVDGSEIDPINWDRHGFDDRPPAPSPPVVTYDATINVALDLPTLVVDPAVNNPTYGIQTLVSAHSRATAAQGDTGQTEYLKRISTLHVVTSVPSGTAFAPSLWGPVKLIYDSADIDYDAIFSSLSEPAGTGSPVDINDALADFANPFWRTHNWDIQAFENNFTYGREYAIALSQASLLLHLDPADIPKGGGTATLEDKKELARRIIQMGITTWGGGESSIRGADADPRGNWDTGNGHIDFRADGGHNHGHKWPILLASLALKGNDPSAADLADLVTPGYQHPDFDAQTDNPPNNGNRAQEDDCTHDITQSDIDNSPGSLAIGGGGSGTAIPQGDLGESEWTLRYHQGTPSDYLDWAFDANYKSEENTPTYWGFALAALLTSEARTMWAHEPFFKFMFRYRDWLPTQTAEAGRLTKDDFFIDMWDAYAPASGDVALAGTATGTSSATGTLTKDAGMVGAATGTASATGTLTITGDVSLAGTATGTSSATAVLTNDFALIGTATGTSSATAVLATDVFMVGTATGTSSATGALTIEAGGEVALAGTATGTSSATGLLTKSAGMVGTATGTSSATGALSAVLGLTGTATGTATATGNLTTGNEFTLAPVITLAASATLTTTLAASATLTTTLEAGFNITPAMEVNPVTALRQDWKMRRGDALRLEYAVTLPDLTSFDATDSFKWQARQNKTSTNPTMSKATPNAAQIVPDVTGQTVTVILAPADTASLPDSLDPLTYESELEISRTDGTVLTIAHGVGSITTDIAR